MRIWFAIFMLALACRVSSVQEPEPREESPPAASSVATLQEHGPPPFAPGRAAADMKPGVAELWPQAIADGAQLGVRFTHPMLQVDTGPEAPRVELDPPIAGITRWTGPYDLVFYPEEALPLAQAFAVRVRGSLVTLTGEPLALDASWTFETPRPEVSVRERDEGSYDDSGRKHWKTAFVIGADDDDALRLAELRKHVRAVARPIEGTEGDIDVPIRVRAATARDRRSFDVGAQEFVVVPQSHWPADREIEVVVGRDLKLYDRLSLDRDVSAVMTTEPGLAVEVSCWTEYEDGCAPGPIDLTFSNPIGRSQLRSIRVSPKPPGLKIWFEAEGRDGDVVRINGRFELGENYRITMPPGLTDLYGQPLPVPFDREVAFVLPPPEVTLLGSHGTLAAKDARTVGLQTRWVERVRLRAAVLQDEQLLSQFLREPDDLRIPKQPRKLHDEIIDLAIDGDYGWASTVIDLEALSGGERRPVLIEVEPLELMAQADDRPAPGVVRALYQQTDLGAVSMISPSRSLARVTDLDRARPKPGVEAKLYRGTKTIPAVHLATLDATDPHGLVDLPRSVTLPHRGLLLLHNDNDRLVTRVGRAHHGRRHSWWNQDDPYTDNETLLSTIATERPLYRPGDDVMLVGWSAVASNRAHTGLQALPAGTPVELSLTDRTGEEVAHKRVHTKASGKYWASLSIPATGALGHYSVKAKIDGDVFTRAVRVKDFQTPTFEVRTNVDRSDVVHGEANEVALAATYFFGGSVPIASLRRSVDCSHTSYRPPGLLSSWSVATLKYDDRIRADYGQLEGIVLSREQAESGRTKLGNANDKLQRAGTFRCSLSAAIRDVSMAEAGGDSSWMVHPPAYYAIAQPSGSLQRGDRLAVPVRSTDFAGNRRAEAVTVEIVRSWWEKQPGGYEERTEPARTCSLTTTASDDDPVCVVAKTKEGHYTMTLRPATTAGGQPSATTQVWVGPPWRAKLPAYVPPPRLDIRVEPEHPVPGETAKVKINAPQPTGEGMVVFMHGGVRRTQPFVLSDGRAELDVTVDQAWVPNMELAAVLAVPKDVDSRARLTTATTRVGIEDHHRDLSVVVRAPTVARPNEPIEIALSVRDADDKGTAAHVSVWAVDEAVLSLQEPYIPDLVRTFIVDRHRRTSFEDDFDAILWPYVKRDDPYSPGWTSGGYGRGSGAGFGGRGKRVPQVRSAAATVETRDRFETTPIFIGDVELGPSGEGVVRGTLPENLTTFRITAIAAAKLEGSTAAGKFGHADARTRVTMPVALRVITPRILRTGDQADVAAVVDNLGGPTGTVEVTLSLVDGDGVVSRRGPKSQSGRIEAGGQLRLPFAITADAIGEAGVLMRATLTPDDGTAAIADAMKVSLPVERERTLVRHAAVYGSVAADDPIAIDVKAPTGRMPDTGGVNVRVDVSLLDGLQDVARDLVHYPYGCVEQTSSAVVPLVALGELSRQYPLGLDDVDAFVAAGIARLRSMQTSSGGFGYWPGASEPHFYGTAYAVWVLEQAKLGGYWVPARMHDNARKYLRDEVVRWSRRVGTTPHEDIPIAMALHALSYSDDVPKDALNRMLDAAPTMPPFVRALLLMALHRHDAKDPRVQQLVEDLESLLVWRAGEAKVREGGSVFTQYFDSGPRTSAMILLAFMEARPDHDAVEPVARGLTALRAAGRIRNTQENAYTMLALAAYARHYEADVPSLNADVWVGDVHAVSRRIEGTRFASESAARPFVDLEQAVNGSRVTVHRQGQGRLYYRVGMEWSAADAGARPVAAGIAIETTLRDEHGVVASGTSITPGTLLALDVEVAVDARIDYVAVDIPLPAGLEGVDTSFGQGRRAMVLPGARSFGNHEEIRRDRALVFADALRAGRHVHTVFLRATTPGTFSMPPSVAQSMYMPELQGSTIARTVTVAPVAAP